MQFITSLPWNENMDFFEKMNCLCHGEKSNETVHPQLTYRPFEGLTKEFLIS